METRKKILIVEDELNIAKTMQYNLKKAGYEAEIAGDGALGLTRGLSGEFDLILLDVMLPIMDGFAVCENIRQRSQVPIIMLTARGDDKDKVLGLDIGADDYVTKPFKYPELLARIRSNIRRSPKEEVQKPAERTPGTITLGDLTIDSEHYLVTKKGEPVELSKKEYDFLALLAETPGKPVSREELLEKVWGYSTDFLGDTRNVNVAVSRLRAKIEDDPENPKYLMLKRGVGYYLCRAES